MIKKPTHDADETRRIRTAPETASTRVLTNEGWLFRMELGDGMLIDFPTNEDCQVDVTVTLAKPQSSQPLPPRHRSYRLLVVPSSGD